MTIQMLQQWNGLEAGSIQTLAGSEETRLVGLGLARTYTATTDDHSPLAMTWDPDTGAQAAGQYSVSGGGGNPVLAAALSTYFNAVANRDSAPVKIPVFGDSWTEYRTATAFTNQWTQKVQALLRAKYPTSGLGATGGIGYVPIINATSAGQPPYVNPWTKAGAVGTSFTNGGLGLRYATFANGSDKATITVTATSCVLHFLKGTSSRVGYYKVDGGAAVTFETNVNGVLSDDGFLTINLGASGSHTLEVGWSSGGVVYLAGAIFFNGDENKGFHFYEGGHTGYRTTDYIGAAAGASALQTRVAAINPHLVIIALGQNDFQQASPNFISAATYKANLKQLISELRAKGVTASFLIVMSADVTVSKDGTQTSTWAQFQAAAKQVAIEDTGNTGGTSGVGVVSITDAGVIAPSTGGAGGDWVDALHVGDTGHAAVASVVYGAISR